MLFLPLLLLSGCNWAILDPQGPIGRAEKSLVFTAVILMLIVVVPVIVLTLAFAWHFRASNKKAVYRPDFHHSTTIEIVVWVIPCLIVLALGILTWKTTHALDPYKPLVAQNDEKPIEVDVIALDWKWLFVYPQLHIASVNELAMPVGASVDFRITSGTVMNAFFIPQLGTQIYAMGGMQTEVHLAADHAGTYHGLSANFSGDGFSGMTFNAIAMDQSGFDAWVQKVRGSSQVLDTQSYAQLSKASENVPVTYYGTVNGDIFGEQIASFVGSAPSMKMKSNGDQASAKGTGAMNGMSGM
ncbi:ubiquinol oxidase subunit II [Acidisoma silvae]|uniref:Ubiquinol oxidase subunit 2 n=1 Tax=Acidisoma silvae TaxID=2802396 RepID=A0A963YUU1_9PROT|nr:ubiquinol oxidase subunit II [Acidisoma silvae]MCB8876713.1 ubiquinol oxidase subunit II [Acidisoma silvae]